MCSSWKERPGKPIRVELPPPRHNARRMHLSSSLALQLDASAIAHPCGPQVQESSLARSTCEGRLILGPHGALSASPSRLGARMTSCRREPRDPVALLRSPSLPSLPAQQSCSIACRSRPCRHFAPYSTSPS